MGSMIKNSIKLFMVFSLTVVLFAGSAFAHMDTDDREYNVACRSSEKTILKGEYENAIKIYDDYAGKFIQQILEIFEMKGHCTK